MSFQIFETISICVGPSHRSGTINFVGDIIFESSKEITGHCSICNRKKSMTVSDNKKLAEGLGDFFENNSIEGRNASKKIAKNVLKNPGRHLDIGPNVGIAFASKSPKTAPSTLPEFIDFYNTRDEEL